MLSKLNPAISLAEPEEDIINSLVLSEMKKHVPIGSNWFSEEAVNSGELSKLLRALSKEIALWIASIKVSKNGSFISSAAGQYLDRWGRDVGVTRLAGESDEQYRFRIKKTLILSRVTSSSIEETVFDNTKDTIDYTNASVSVLEPWIFQERRSRRAVQSSSPIDYFYGRSGKTRRTGSDRDSNYDKPEFSTSSGDKYYPSVIKQCYFQGGVIDVVTPGFSSKTSEIVQEMIAAGVKAFFTVVEGYTIPNPKVATSVTINSESSVEAEPFGSFRDFSIFSRSGPTTSVDEVTLLSEERLDVVGLVGRSGSRVVFSERDVEYFINDGEEIGYLPPATPELASPVSFTVDSYPAYRSLFRKELSPRSGAEGSLFHTSLDWTADTLVELSSLGAVENKNEIEYEGFTQFDRVEKNIVRSVSVRSGRTNPYQDTEFENFAPMLLSASADVQFEAEYFKYDLVGSYKSILSMALFPRSGPEEESFVLSPIELEFTSLAVYPISISSITTEMVFPFIEKSFTAAVAYPDETLVSLEYTLSSEISYIGISEELVFFTENVLSKTWETLGLLTWTEALTVGGTKQFSAEVIVGP